MIFETYNPTLTQLRVLQSDGTNNLSSVFKITGMLDEKKLIQSIEAVIRNAAPFSFRFLKFNQDLKILTSPDSVEAVSIIDASTQDSDTDESSIFTLVQSLLSRNFKLDRGAPYSFSLIRGRAVYYLVFVSHPALLDRFSLKTLFQSISDAYNDIKIFRPLGLSQKFLEQEEKKFLQSDKKEESIRFWLQISQESSFEWRPARIESDLSDNAFTCHLNSIETQEFINISHELNLKIESILRFCFHIFLSRITKSDTIITSHYHRISTGPEDLIGFNENKPVLKSVIDSKMSLRQYFKNESKLAILSKYHSDLPAHEMTKELKRIDTQFERPTNVLFTEDCLPNHYLNLNNLESHLLSGFSYHLETEDIGVYFDVGNTIQFHVITKTPSFISSVKMSFEHYLVLLKKLRSILDTQISEIDLFDDELKKLVEKYSHGEDLETTPRNFLQNFTEAVKKYPDAIAISDNSNSLTYSKLEASAKEIAKFIYEKSEKQFLAKQDVLVGLCLPRKCSMIESILGTLYSGAAYLPLDPKMPAERLAFISQDANLSLVITDAETQKLISPYVKCEVLIFEDFKNNSSVFANSNKNIFPLEISQNQAAYVIYTSGTTGKPKGVIIEHKALANFIAALNRISYRGPGSRWMQFASFNFDASVLEIFNPLSFGGELVIAPNEVRTDPEALFQFMHTKKISHTLIPPALMPLLPRKPLPDLKTLFTGGEVVDEETSRFWSKVVDFVNCYGPTEATVMCTHNKLGGYKTTLQLGRPLPGYLTYLLDENGKRTPLGGVGEICIGGNSVARGYLGRPDLTALKFIQNPYGKGQLYRTGDLARFLPNGEFEFLGRNDFQVKIRGFRIELGDIENAITEQPEVRGAYVAVTTQTTHDSQSSSRALIAWYIAQGLSPDELRSRLSEKLPHYMVPSFLIRLDQFPLNVNGKIDRTRLPQPSQITGLSVSKFDSFEEEMRKIWANLLKVNNDLIHLDSHFFHLGGHSLLAALVCTHTNNKFGTNIRPKLLFEYPVFVDFCEKVRALPKESSEFKPLTATHTQQAFIKNRLIELIYSRAVLNPDDNMYNIAMRLDIDADINPIRLQKVLTEFLKENSIFNSYFAEINNQIRIEFDPQVSQKIQIPLSEATEEEIQKKLEALRLKTFNIHKVPLWIAEILVNTKNVTILFCVHHIIFDGWSLNLMIEELIERYEAASKAENFKKENITWFDYCNWSTDVFQSKIYLESLEYWRNKLDNINARVELPVKSFHKFPNSNRYKTIRIPPVVVVALKRFADKHNMTLPPVFMALYLVWVWRITDQSEIICGYPYAGRDISGSENIFGTFVTMGYLRQKIHAHTSFQDFALSTHKQMLEDKEHLIAAPYDLEISGMDSLNLIFSLQSGIGLEGKIRSSNFKAEELPSATSKGDLTGVFYENSDGSIEGRIEFDSSVLEEFMMNHLIDLFEQIIISASKNPTAHIRELKYQNDFDQQEFFKNSLGESFASIKTHEFISHTSEKIWENNIVDQFRFIAKKYPQNKACNDLTYEELDMWSDQIAQELKPEFIGLCMQKSTHLIAAILGILKARGTYVPLDPSYPVERLNYFIKDSSLKTILVDENTLNAEVLQSFPIIYLYKVSELQKTSTKNISKEALRISPDQLAYIIYTSGTTGTPKGVMIEHKNVVGFIQSVSHTLNFNSSNKNTLIASVNFDASIFEIFLPLLNGGQLFIVSDSVRKNPSELHKFLYQNKITHSLIMPALLQNMPQNPLPSMQVLAFGGDTLDEKSAQYWSKTLDLYTLYGPTEITVAASYGKIIPNKNHRIIGKPLPEYRIYLLNSDLQPVPFGTIGEICIGGPMVSRGYLNQEELTLKKFTIDPFGKSPYEFIYHSGDLGRMLPGGNIEFIGRNDNQVKLRGFRIELEEIETKILEFEGVDQAVCSLKGEGNNRNLSAYYISKFEINQELLRDNLSKLLPEYMIPTFFIRLESFPLSPSGKVDRKALPTISIKKCESPPYEGLEQQIAEIWEEILCLKGIGRDENFFHIGGNSLLVVRLQSELKQRLSIEFSIGEFYNNPTIMALASRQSKDHISLAIEDASHIVQVPYVAEKDTLKLTSIENILLTGASGFLGVFLLDQLLKEHKKVCCLIRAEDENQGLENILNQAKRAGLSLNKEQIQVVIGDLSKPFLGLKPSQFKILAQNIDSIIHCGAYVHHLHSYSTMKAANVNSTIELLKLALEEKQKSFTYVSTQTVGSSLPNTSEVTEFIYPTPPESHSGYILTKWVCEQICAKISQKHNLPILIARPGNITGNSKDGFTNYTNNHFWFFNKGCIQLGSYPNVQTEIEMTPVDNLAKAIVAMALNPKPGLEVANLSNPLTLKISDFYSELSKIGLKIKPLNPEDWQKQLETINEKNTLSTIKEFYQGDLNQAHPIRINRTQSQKRMSELGLSLNQDPRQLIPVYINYLRKEKFLS